MVLVASARRAPRGTRATAAEGWRIVECITQAFDLAATLQLRHLARGTSLTSRTLLAVLDRDGPAQLSGLAGIICVTPPVISQLVGRMEREGLVVRRVDPADRRVTLVDITEAGRVLRVEQRQSQHALVAEVLDTLSPEDEVALGLAMSEALPVLERLSAAARRCAGNYPGSVEVSTQARGTTRAVRKETEGLR